MQPQKGFRTFLTLWATQSFSVLGSMLTFFAISIWLTQTLYAAPEQKPQLALALSAISLARMLPMVFLAPIAGAWADRHQRGRMMMMADLGNGLISAVLVILMVTGALQIWMLVGLLALTACCDTFHQSAFESSYVMIVPRDMLPRANGMMQTVFSLSGVISPGLAALVVSLPIIARSGAAGSLIAESVGRLGNGVALAIGFDGVTFLVSAAVLLFLHIPSPAQRDGGRRPSLWGDVREGAAYIFDRKPLLWLLGTFAFANLMLSSTGVFLPLLVKFNLAADWGARHLSFETAMATMGSVGSAGGVLAGLAVSAWGGLKRRRIYGVLVPMIFSGLALAGLGLSPLLFLSAPMFMLVQGTMPLTGAHSHAIWQTQTPPELQGRVFAVRRVIGTFTAPLATAIAGFVGGSFNPGIAMGIMGTLLAGVAALQLFNPHLIRLEETVGATAPTAAPQGAA